MYWYIWWAISVGIFLATTIDAFVLSKIRYRRKRILTPNKMLIFGTFMSASFLLCPIYMEKFSDSLGWVEWIKSILLSMQHAVRLFAFEGGYMEFFDADTVNGLPENVGMLYTGTSAVLYTFAPLLTVGFILSFFNNITAYRKYLFSFWKHTHVFSELNEKSLALAKSIDSKYNKIGNGDRTRYRFWRKALIVFTDVIDKDDEENIELVEEAKEIGAILFSKDLESVKYRKRKLSIRKVSFYLISDDEGEKIRHAEGIINDYGKIKNTKLYLFSNDIESKCFLDSYTDKDRRNLSMEVARINDIRALVYHNLNENGMELFKNANETADGSREISAVIIGLGQYGIEMLKALLWFCQLPGYRIKINVFDEQEESESIFKAQCPDIEIGKNMDGEGEMKYTLNIHRKSFGTEEFYKSIQQVSDETYIFVCLGTDNQNISAATGIRNWLAKYGQFPHIETVVYDSSLKKRICGEFTSRNITVIGDLESFYSEGTVIDSALIDVGFEVHKRWGDEGANAKNNYCMNDYNFYSSLASGLHRNLRKNIVEFEKLEKDEAKRVFPFYCSDNANPLMRELLPELNDNIRIKALSQEMTEFADCLYIKLAHLHYMKLSPDNRKKAIEYLNEYLENKQLSLNYPMETDLEGYCKGYDDYIRDIKSDKTKKKAMRQMFECIIRLKVKGIKDEEKKRRIIHDLEYKALSDMDKKAVEEYLKRQFGILENERMEMDIYFQKGKCFSEIEHIRWNAYMRTEGFRCAIETNKKNKLHYDLVPSDMLTFADSIKDI